MKVFITSNAEENLRSVYNYHCEYSFQYADRFNDEILEFIIKNLSEFPEIGIVHNAKKSIRRLVFGNYNIYYLNKDDVAYILYIIDGRMNLNTELEGEETPLPPLE